MKLGSSIVLILIVISSVSVNGNLWNTIVEWVEGPPGKIIVDNLGQTQGAWSLISNTAAGNVSVKMFTVQGWFNSLDITKGLFPILGSVGILVDGDTKTKDACKSIPPHPEETIAEVLAEITEDLNTNSTLSNATWFLVVSIKNKACDYDHVLSLAEEAGYSSVIFRNLDANDTANAPSNFSGNTSTVFAWSIGDHDGLQLQEEYSYPDSASARLIDLRLLRFTMKVLKIVGMCFGGGAVVAATTAVAVVTVVKIKKNNAAAAAAAALTNGPSEKTPLLSPTFVESPPMTKKLQKPGLTEIFTTATVSPSQLSEKLQESVSTPEPEPQPKKPESEDEYTEEECTICAIMLGLTTPHKHRVLKKPKRSRKVDPARRYRTQVSVPAPDSAVTELPNPIPPLQRTSSLLSSAERIRSNPPASAAGGTKSFTRAPILGETSAFQALIAPAAAAPLSSSPLAKSFVRTRSVSCKEDEEENPKRSNEGELTSSFRKDVYLPAVSQPPLIQQPVQLLAPGPGLMQAVQSEDLAPQQKIWHESEEELAAYFPEA